MTCILKIPHSREENRVKRKGLGETRHFESCYRLLIRSCGGLHSLEQDNGKGCSNMKFGGL